MGKSLRHVVVSALFACAAPLAFADVVLTGPTGLVSFPEDGTPHVLEFGIFNNTATAITVDGSGFGFGFVFPPVDASDNPVLQGGGGTNLCPLAPFILSPGKSCNFAAFTLTPDIGAGETDKDFALGSFNADVTYGPTTDETTLRTSGTWRVTDPGFVPEPATLALLGIGLAGLGFARRRKQ